MVHSTKHNRKEENIKLLKFLLDKIENDKSLEDIRLGQLISWGLSETQYPLFYIESSDLQSFIEKSLTPKD